MRIQKAISSDPSLNRHECEARWSLIFEEDGRFYHFWSNDNPEKFSLFVSDSTCIVTCGNCDERYCHVNSDVAEHAATIAQHIPIGWETIQRNPSAALVSAMLR